MAQRKWFTPGICQGMTEADCKIMNRAVRNLVGMRQATTLELMEVRMTYKPGMSAREILDTIEEKLHSKEANFYTNNGGSFGRNY